MENRILGIDVLKGIAIISVLLLHSLDSNILHSIYAQVWIGQAVPIFILITFYLSFLSIEKKGGVKSWYSWPRLSKMLRRILVPFLIVLLVQCILLVFTSHFDPHKIITQGGVGPGSYYIWIYLQVWFLVPFFYALLRKNVFVGAIAIYAICIGLNVICIYWCSDDAWRLLAVRYLSLSVIAWIWLHASALKTKGKVSLLLLGLISLIYLLLLARYDMSPWIYFGSWTSQNYPVFFWTLILVVFLLKVITGLPERMSVVLSWLGRYSWEIFLSQMFFIGCVSLKRFPQIVNSNLTQICYVLFVFVISIGSVVAYSWVRRLVCDRTKNQVISE